METLDISSSLDRAASGGSTLLTMDNCSARRTYKGSYLIVSCADVLTWTFSQFQHIYDHTQHEYPAVGVLGAANRDLWAKVSRRFANQGKY